MAQAQDKPVAVVVDDEPTIRQMISLVLRLDGWEVVTFADSPSALQAHDVLARARVFLIDVVLHDGIDGFALAKTLRLAGRKALVVAVTGSRHQSEGDWSVFDFVFEKPFTMADLRRLFSETRERFDT